MFFECFNWKNNKIVAYFAKIANYAVHYFEFIILEDTFFRAKDYKLVYKIPPQYFSSKSLFKSRLSHLRISIIDNNNTRQNDEHCPKHQPCQMLVGKQPTD